jgi:hypothetical protein
MNIKMQEEKDKVLKFNKKIGAMLKEVRGDHTQLKVSIRLSGLEGKYASREMIARYEAGKNRLPLDIYKAYVKIYGETESLHQIGLLLGYIDNPLLGIKKDDRVAVKQDERLWEGIVESVTSNKIKLKYSSLVFDKNGVSDNGEFLIMPITNKISNTLFREQMMDVINSCKWKNLNLTQLKKIVKIIANG